MTPHQILIVGIRLFAIYWFLGILGLIAASIAGVDEIAANAFPLLVMLGLQFVFCVFLWFFPSTLASKLLRGGHSVVSAESVAPFAEWRDLLFVTVGMFVLARSIPNIAYWALLAGASDPLAPTTPEQKTGTFAALLELLIGFGLVFGARGLGSMIQKLRTAGRP